MKLVDALVTTLRDWELRYVFGVSGANIEHVHDALFRLGDGRIRAVLAKSEVGAAFMADCRARVHKTLGVCCATSGGGMMNLAVGIAEAYAESVPMLALIGQVPLALEGRGGFQDSSGIGRTVDALALFKSMSKYTARVDSAESFWETLYAAVKAALSGRPGPSVLLFSRSAYDLEVKPKPSWFPDSIVDIVTPLRASPEAVRALFEALRHAVSPVMILGTGIDRCTDPKAVTAFVQCAQIPVVTTMGNPGAFPHEDPLFLGTIGAAGHPSAHTHLNEHADLVVAVGTGLNVLTRHPLGLSLSRARLGIVNVDPGEILRTANPEFVVESDAGVAFGEMLELWHSCPFVHGPVASYELTHYKPVLVEPVEGEARAKEIGKEEMSSLVSPLLQSEAIEAVGAYLPPGGHVLFDAGNCAAAALHLLAIPRGSSTTIALGMGGMGYAIAGAVGAQLGDSGRRTTVLCGDGAFLMLGFEVHTAVELGLPILFVVFNNGKHGMCVTRQKLFFDGRVDCAEYTQVDIAASSRGFGSQERLWVGRASTRRGLADKLAEYEAMGHTCPGVLELVLEREEMPPFSPFLEADAETYVARAALPASGRQRPAA